MLLNITQMPLNIHLADDARFSHLVLEYHRILTENMVNCKLIRRNLRIWEPSAPMVTKINNQLTK